MADTNEDGFPTENPDTTVADAAEKTTEQLVEEGPVSSQSPLGEPEGVQGSEAEREEAMAQAKQRMQEDQLNQVLEQGKIMMALTLEVTTEFAPQLAKAYTALFEAFKAEGFTEEQAFRILEKQNIGGK